MDLTAMTTRRLLRLYAEILTELLRRGVIRSRNAPVGDLAEDLVRIAFGGELAPKSEKSWDVRAAGRLLQVKARLIAANDRRSHTYSPFRSWDFDACVFVIFDAHTYDIVSAVEVPVSDVQELARESAWVKGYRIGTRSNLRAIDGAIDRTDDLRRAFDSLEGAPPAPGDVAPDSGSGGSADDR